MTVKVIASKMELCCACPAAPARSLPFPFVESEASIRGSKLHEITALLLQTGMESFDDLTMELDEADKQAVKTCFEVGEILRPKGPHIRMIEEKMDLKFVGSTTGKPDLAYYDQQSKTVCVVDWKFGSREVPDPTGNKQLMAYAIAVTKFLKGIGHDVEQAYLVICQPCGTPRQSYKDAKFPAQVFPTWEKEIKDAITAAQEKDAPATPGPWCKKCFCEAGKNGACPEFKAYSGEISEAKADKKTKDAQFAVSGFLPVIVEGPGPQFPLVVISEEAIAKANDFLAQSGSPITDQASANATGLRLQEITKFEGQVEANRKVVKAPVVELGRLIDEKAKQALIPLAEAKAKDKANLDKWVREQNEISEKAQHEAKRLIDIQVQAEAKARQEVEDAGKRAQQATTQAERLKAIEEAREAAQRRLLAEQQAQALIPVVTQPVKIAGVKLKLIPEYEILDFPKVPDIYKVIDEKMLKTAITQEKVTDKDGWISIKWVERAESSGKSR